MLKRLLFAVAVIVSAAPALATPRVALVVGIARYEHIAPLRNTVRDADLISAQLRNVGFEVTTLLDASGADLDRALREFSFKAEVADIAMLYYAGHGVEVRGRNFVLAADSAITRMDDVAAQGFALDRLLASTATARKLRIVVLDSCRDSPFPAVDGVDAFASTFATQVEQGTRVEARGTLVVYSTRDGAPALDGDGLNSPFALALADNLARSGVEIGMVFRRARDQVLARTGGQQEPYTYGSLSGSPLFLAGEGDGAGSPETDKREAWSAMRPDDVAQLVAQAEGGDVRSLIGLAYIHQNPQDERYNPSAAFDYLKMAAEAGSAEAQFELGKAMERGIGTPVDTAQAIHWFNRAAEQDFGDALNDLGYLYLQGSPQLPRDRQKGVALFLRAANHGHPEAMYNAATLIDDGLVEGYDSEQAASYLYRAIRAGSEEVLRQLSDKPTLFTRATRQALQRILADNGFYESDIDGLFGAGTRRSLRLAYGLSE